MKTKITQQVYHDTKRNLIFTIKRRCKRFLLIGGVGSPFYSDAQSSLSRYHLPNGYFIKNCVPVSETSDCFVIEKHGYPVLKGRETVFTYYKPTKLPYRSQDILTNRLAKKNKEKWGLNDYADDMDARYDDNN